MTHAIRTARLTRDFGDIRALDGVTLDVPAGSIFGLLGPNGAGKTTLIRVLLGLMEPTSGEAEVLGLPVSTASAAIRAQSGALLEHCGLYERLTAEQNLDLYARFWNMPAEERVARIGHVLSRMELWDRRRDIVSSWSRGMKQKLAIARAMFHQPPLLFLDEPTAGLDSIAARALRAGLTKLTAGGGVTVFLTTHNLAEVEQICSDAAIINRGRIVRVGSPSALRGSKASLEDAFVELVGAPQ
jgi:ABC-2 type transport system ATP-binding protein